MDPVLAGLLGRGGGLLTRAAAVEVVPRWRLERAHRRGDLVRLLPGVYRGRTVAVDRALRRRAALLYADGRGVLSHTTALAVWGLDDVGDDTVHLTVPSAVRLRSRPGLAVHRTDGPRSCVVRAGAPVVRLERALVEAWPLLAPDARPAAVIRAVNDRMTTPERIRSALDRASRLPDRATLRALLDRLAAGCRSPLEIWGHDRVFTGPGMPRFQRQVRVRVGGRTAYLDVYAERERVAFELDGAATHGSAAQREADLRRDALLATLGLLVVRFSHRRLVYETAAVRAEVLAVLSARRRGTGPWSGARKPPDTPTTARFSGT